MAFIGIGYETTNLVNGKNYFGIHEVKDPDKMDPWYLGSGVLLLKAVKKYGIENFHRDIHEVFKNEESMLEWEEKTVTIDVVNDSNNYNLRTGGRYRTKFSVESIAKLSKSAMKRQRERFKDPEERKKISRTKKRQYAENPEMCERARQISLQYYAENPEARKKIKEAMNHFWEGNVGARNAMSEIKKSQYAENPEIREKISRTKKLQYAENPEMCERARQISLQYYAENPEAGKEHGERMKHIAASRREAGILAHDAHPVIINGDVFMTRADAGKANNLSPQTIANRIKAGKEGYRYLTHAEYYEIAGIDPPEQRLPKCRP